MEQILRAHLLTLAVAYSDRTGRSLARIATMAANEWRFFAKLEEERSRFSVRTYDQVVAWFDENWPADLAWPSDVPRPSACASSGAEGTTPEAGSTASGVFLHHRAAE